MRLRAVGLVPYPGGFRNAPDTAHLIRPRLDARFAVCRALPVFAVINILERLVNRRQLRLPQLARGHGHTHFVNLPTVAHVHIAYKGNIAVGDPFAHQRLTRFFLQLPIDRVEPRGVEGRNHWFRHLAQVDQVRADDAPRRKLGRMCGNNDFFDAHIAGVRADVERPRAAERQQHKVAWVIATPDAHLADEVCHFRVENVHDAERGVLD